MGLRLLPNVFLGTISRAPADLLLGMGHFQESDRRLVHFNSESKSDFDVGHQKPSLQKKLADVPTMSGWPSGISSRCQVKVKIYHSIHLPGAGMVPIQVMARPSTAISQLLGDGSEIGWRSANNWPTTGDCTSTLKSLPHLGVYNCFTYMSCDSAVFLPVFDSQVCVSSLLDQSHNPLEFLFHHYFVMNWFLHLHEIHVGGLCSFCCQKL